MKTSFFGKAMLFIFSCAMSFVACNDENSPETSIDNLTVNNFPIIDGSDSTTPLRTILMCNLMGLNYKWEQKSIALDNTWFVKPNYEKMDNSDAANLRQRLKESNTHDSFINLINGTVELILTARSISRDESQYAEEKGVSLIETPIAKDAFIFIVNPENPVSSLTINQIQKIYTGYTRNWFEIGGNNQPISPYIRNRNSGSQEKMETTVMEGLTMIDWPEMVGGAMMSPYWQIADDVNGIGFTPFYYFNTIVNNNTTKALAINGISPNKENIVNGTYPYITEVFAIIRRDIDKSSMAYKVYETLLSTDGRKIIEESRNIPIN